MAARSCARYRPPNSAERRWKSYPAWSRTGSGHGRAERRRRGRLALGLEHALQRLALQRLVLDQRAGKPLQRVAVVGEDLAGARVGRVDEGPDLLVDRLGDLLGVILLLGDLAPQEDQLLFVAEGDRTEALAHPVFGDHAPR